MPNVTIEISGKLADIAQAVRGLPSDMQQQQIAVSTQRTIATRVEADGLKAEIGFFKTAHPTLDVHVTYTETD